MKNLINQPEYIIKKILFGALYLLGSNGEKYVKPKAGQEHIPFGNLELTLLESAEEVVKDITIGREMFEITRSYLNNLIQIELAYTGVTHLDYDKNSDFNQIKLILTKGMNGIK